MRSASARGTDAVSSAERSARRAREQRAQRARVLLRQQLGRRHQRRLLPALAPPPPPRAHATHGLAAADVALEQPVHRVRLGEVARDLAPGALLRGREAERQRAPPPPRRRGRAGRARRPAPSRARHGAARARLRAGTAPRARAARARATAAAAAPRGRPRLGAVDAAQRLGRRRQLALARELRGQRARHQVRVVLDRERHPAPERPRRHALGRRVVGHDAFRGAAPSSPSRRMSISGWITSFEKR